jgi:hypothetical protein
MREKGFLAALSEAGENKFLSALRSACSLPFRQLARTSFIEWRYYSLISKEFHGIFGAAIFNPEQRLAQVAESGLLVIVAGVAGLAASAEAAPLPDNDFCWMKLFPMSSLTFLDDGAVSLFGEHDSVSFKMQQFSDSHSRVELEGIRAPTLSFESRALEGTQLAPQIGRDVSFFPGTHWVVNNPAPVATTSGKMRIQNLPGKTESSLKFPNYVSSGVNLDQEISLDGSGYYEHSFGMNPMPLHGWDFCFVPNAVAGNSLVMQTYRESRELRYVDVHWTANGVVRHLRFGPDDLQVQWTRGCHHSEIKKNVPVERAISGQTAGYSLEVRNHVRHRIPFLRPEKFFVRHFFISEEISTTSWTLKNSSGDVVCEVVNQPSGGETASFRLFV